MSITQEQNELLVRIDERVGVLIVNQEDQEKRIRGLERFRNWSSAVVTLTASAFGYKINTP